MNKIQPSQLVEETGKYLNFLRDANEITVVAFSVLLH